jgi:hypothetical protein
MTTTPFFDASTFAWTRRFIERFDGLSAESSRYFQHMTPLYPQHTESTDGKRLESAKWFARTLTFFTIRNGGLLKHMPLTAELLSHVPNLTSALLLKLEGGTHIRPHAGYTPDVVRCHLGLSVPEVADCVLRVADERRNWREREWLVFDDYLEHEVWHNGRQSRLVLLIDVVRPGVQLAPRDVAMRFFSEAPGTRFDDDLRSVAPPRTWLQWVEDGMFPV